MDFKNKKKVENNDLTNEFIEFLIVYANNTKKENINFVLEELIDLANRQWHQYKLLDLEVRKQLEKYILSVIDFEDESIMDYILSIIPLLGLKSLFDEIIQKKETISNEVVIANINDAEKEYGCNVENPYSGM